MSNQAQLPRSPPFVSGWHSLRSRAGPWPGLLVLVVTLALYATVPHLHRHGHANLSKPVSDFLSERQANFRNLIVFSGVLLAALTLRPSLAAVAERLRPRWRTPHTLYVLSAVCVLFSFALVKLGRHQFGGFDYNAMLEVGWRQVLGQRMYVDFLTPTPPGFNLGIKYAMSVFGATWDANLYLNCIFGCVTLLWMYGLLRQLDLGRPVALFVALVVECESVLLLSFWWYNDTTLVLSAIFLLACLAYIKRPSSAVVAASYVASFTLLALMKPNIAGLTLAGGLLLLFLAVRDRVRLVWLTAVALGLIALVFFVNHISLPAMVATYREVARERGGLSLVGLHQQDKLSRKIAAVAFAILALPGLWLLPRWNERFRRPQWDRMATLLYFPLALMIAVYGLMSNGESWQVECAPLVAVLAVFVFGTCRSSYKPWMRHMLLALLGAHMASNIFLGFTRIRVETIGLGMFFEWKDNERLITAGPLKNMRVSATMIDVQEQIQEAVGANTGPYYFGPRVDYSYFALGISSPRNRPAWWHPGTAFGRQQQPQLIHLWQEQSFNTLIFLKGDYTYYPPEFMQAIQERYRRDDTYPTLTVYHRQ